MQLPIDISALLKAATDTKEAAETPLAVSVFIDDSAPGDVVGHVRSAFASAGARTRVTISYLGAGMPAAYEGDDLAVIVAGVSEHIGRQAAALREAGIPVMVVSTLPGLVREMAEAFGHPIPEADLLSPIPVPKKAAEGGAEAAEQAAAGDAIVLDEEGTARLDTRMGEWIIATRRDKRLAFALAFPFVRRPLSHELVRTTALQNGAVGLVPLAPAVDMPIMTLNQCKMLLQIAAAYGQPMTLERAKELAAVVGGAFALRNAARSMVGLVPVLGWAIRAGVGFAGTEAMGRAAIEYFEAGGDIVGFAAVVQKARDEAVDAASAAADTPAGRRALDFAKNAAGNVFDGIRTRK